ncbi:integrase arm-type DNA-binding domain-containing protein [Bradyrhizobium sp. dw_78]|uniref:integrase arm-type DNA-binding domain-containing protein n=1 Tax=Bradyrhizobium sp. dw_78 TaxID=2719793 RepID=UPI001BD38957|nr:integrase arm-type DNA-binding domain-containing protein [Bradyrhizobium sp. dw_78]
MVAAFICKSRKGGAGDVTRSWLFQYSWNGKVRQVGLGSYQQASLAQARKRAKAARDKLANGIDPIGEKRLRWDEIGERMQTPSLTDV